MAITIRLYEHKMKQQVTALFSKQYGVAEETFSKLLDHFYDHPYQKDKSIRIVAVDGDKVVGFQSFFYWPYYYQDKELRVFQSGNSLVHPGYRGQQIFARLLGFLDEHRAQLKIDLLIGFPIAASINSLVRNGWQHTLDLQWYVCRGSALSLCSSEQKQLDKCFTSFSTKPISDNSSDYIRLSSDADFVKWRSDYSTGQPYRYFRYESKDGITEFTLKPSRRKRIIRELVIGDIRSTSYDPHHLSSALRELVAEVRKHRTSTIISFAANPHNTAISRDVLNNAGFRSIRRTVFFCMKNFSAPKEFQQPEKWMLYRSDIDTW